jgi:DNA-binding NtrC family response regulator
MGLALMPSDDSRVTREVIRNCLLLEVERAREALKRVEEKSPAAANCRVLLSAAEANSSFDRAENLAARLAARVECAGDDPLMLEALLVFGAHACALENRYADAKRYLGLLEGVDGGSGWAAMRAQRLFAEGRLSWMLGEVDGLYGAGTAACAAGVEPGSMLDYRLKLVTIQAALSSGDWRGAERMIDELSSLSLGSAYLDKLLFLRKARLLVLRGLGQQALDLIADEGRFRGEGGAFRIAVRNYRIRALLILGRLDEALELTEDSIDVIGDDYAEFVRAKVCLIRLDSAGARAHIRRAVLVAASGRPLLLHDLTTYGIVAELMDGNSRGARRLLDMIDKDGRDSFLFGQRAWLALLEGREADAVGYFRRILEKGDLDFTRESLRYLTGASADQVARLWAAALDSKTDGRASGSDVGARDEEELPPRMVGRSDAMRVLSDTLRRYAELEETALITGETGTGKELAARFLHHQGRRAQEPFIPVNCGALSDTLIESELFGHVKGAFTGAEEAREGLFKAAGRGTIFLDEVSSMSARLQGALLRVLETGEVRPVGSSRSVRVSARVVAASNQPLGELVESGAFRSDLFFRLERLRIDIPPLRERREDIPELVRFFLGQFCDHGDVALGEDLLRVFAAHDWPGNVRELKNEVERVVLLAGGETVLHSGLSRLGGGGRKGARRTAQTRPRSRDRLAALREVFREQPELTRAEVVEILGCAPNTATKYLKMLIDEGHIERVMTSGSLRTSYFRRCRS